MYIFTCKLNMHMQASILTEIDVKQPHMHTNARIYMDAKKCLILSCWIIIYGTGYFYSDIYNYKIITL